MYSVQLIPTLYMYVMYTLCQECVRLYMEATHMQYLLHTNACYMSGCGLVHTFVTTITRVHWPIQEFTEGYLIVHVQKIWLPCPDCTHQFKAITTILRCTLSRIELSLDLMMSW